MTLPASDSIDTYGGELVDYGVAVVDPTTDRSAAAANKAYASTAMMTRTAIRGDFTFTGAGSAPTTPTDYEYVWKGSTATAPTPARSATGIFTFTLPTTVSDELAATHTVSLRKAWGQARGATRIEVQCTVATNVITVHTFNAAGAANDAVGTVIDVFFC